MATKPGSSADPPGQLRDTPPVAATGDVAGDTAPDNIAVTPASERASELALTALAAFPILKRIRRFLTEDTHNRCTHTCAQCSFRTAAGEDLPLTHWNEDVGNLSAVNRMLREELWSTRLRSVVIRSTSELQTLQKVIPLHARLAIQHFCIGPYSTDWEENFDNPAIKLPRESATRLKEFLASCRNLRTLYGLRIKDTSDPYLVQVAWPAVTQLSLSNQSILVPKSLPASFPRLERLTLLEITTGLFTAAPQMVTYRPLFSGTFGHLRALDLHIGMDEDCAFQSRDLQAFGGPQALFEAGALKLLQGKLPYLRQLDIRVIGICIPGSGAYHLREWCAWAAQLRSPLEAFKFWVSGFAWSAIIRSASLQGFGSAAVLANQAQNPNPPGWTPIVNTLASEWLCKESFKALAKAVPTLALISLSHTTTDLPEPFAQVVGSTYSLVQADLHVKGPADDYDFIWRRTADFDHVVARIDRRYLRRAAEELGS